MPTEMELSIEQRLLHLFDHLGLTQAHFAARTPTDWNGMATSRSECMASLTLVCPTAIDADALRSLAARFLLITGDHGAIAERMQSAAAALAGATHLALPHYRGLIWDDAVADHPEMIGQTLRDFLQRMAHQRPLQPVALPTQEGEHAGIFYRIQGAGPPLLLLPLGLAPSQWEPLLPALARHYCTILLGGPALGTVTNLEVRSRTGYLRVVQRLAEAMAPQPGDTILEAGCGSGALTRWLAQWTEGRNRLVGVDVNPYMLREAQVIARHAHLEDRITFQEGNAEDLPFPAQSFDLTLSCTMIEEVDANRTLAELVRATKSAGRVGVIVRAMDMPWWVNVPLDAPLKTAIESASRLGNGQQPQGCAEASLYRRMQEVGLVQIQRFPQWATYTEGSYMQAQRGKLLMNLSPEDTQKCREALARVDAEGAFVLAEPFHCAVGIKP